jgi:hypothetical protein
MKETTEASTHRKLIRPSLTEVREQQKRMQEEQQKLLEQRMQERRQQQQRPPEPRQQEPRQQEVRQQESREPRQQESREPRQQESRHQEPRSQERRQGDHRQQDNRRGEHRSHDKRRPEGRPPDKRPQPEAKPKRSVPPDQTNAENFYYVKQMQNRTPIAVILRDGEELRGPPIAGPGLDRYPSRPLLPARRRLLGCGSKLLGNKSRPPPIERCPPRGLCGRNLLREPLDLPTPEIPALEPRLGNREQCRSRVLVAFDHKPLVENLL